MKARLAIKSFSSDSARGFDGLRSQRLNDVICDSSVIVEEFLLSLTKVIHLVINGLTVIGVLLFDDYLAALTKK